MDLKEIINNFKEHDLVRGIVRAFEQGNKTHIQLKGMAGSSPALIATACFELHPISFLAILNDHEEAAYFFNDLENLLGEKNVLFFPASYRKPYHVHQPDNTNVLSRAEVLSRVSKSSHLLIVVTYSEAVHEKVVTKKALEQNTIEARVGESLSIEFISEFLIANGFERTDFVFDPGQFAVRGGIIDVFSFANELPYRIELAGEEVESIRSFDPITQLSEKNLNHFTIIPNVQKQVSKKEMESFFKFIPKQTVVWCKDLHFTFEYIHNNLKQLKEQKTQVTDDEEQIVLPPVDEIYETEVATREHLNNFTIVEFGSKSYFENSNVFEFHQLPQPSFNKNFELLSDNFLQNTAKNYKNIIFSDTAKQIERIYAIFEDLHFKAGHADRKIEFSPVLLSLHEGFVDNDLKLACYTDHQVFDRYHRFRLRKNYSRNEALTIKELYSLKPGDYVTHIDHGVGRFGGLEKMEVNGKQQEAIRLVYKDHDILYISIHSLHRIARYSGKEGTVPTMNKLGSNAWATLKQKTKKRVKDIAKDLIELYAKRKSQQGFAFAPDTYLQNELEASFIYEDTPDQVKSTRDVKKDMENIAPMDRLICGDVGFGKTEIAIRAAFKAVTDNKQVAILVPTTLLALQHYRTFKERLKDFPCNIDYINRFKSAAQQTETIRKIKEGKTDIIIGTHRLISKDVQFKNLGLLVIDEEQKFGVGAKEKIKAIKTNVDTLTLTATPIPRTLQFSLMGARDLSIINTAPPNRYPVTTEVHVFNEQLIKEAINYEVSRGGQVFFIHNRVQNIHEMADMIKKLCPDVKIAVGHGQMDGDKLEETMMSFIDGEADVLVSTTIVESGLDISNANTIIINQAQNFGLSDMHQMRGRVGRSNKKAFCYLLTPPLTVLTPEARQRLKAIEEFSDLGSGFNVAMRDLDIRGAGNLLGGEQSGFITEIGFEMYHKILDEAMQELKETDFKGLFPVDEKHKFVSDCQIDTDLEILIPTDYVENTTERLSLYKDLDDIEQEEKLMAFESQLRDRFGPVPLQVLELMDTVRLRWKAKALGFEKIILKNNSLKGYFVSNSNSAFFNSPAFSNVLQYVQSHPSRCKMKEDKGKLSLSFSKIASIANANVLLGELTGVKEKTVSVS